jgi:hypothetical protein
MTKWIAILLGVLLILTNVFWGYMTMDAAVTEKYRQQEEYEIKNKLEAQAKLNHYFVNGMPKEKLKEILVSLFPDFEPFEKEGMLNTMWLSFKIDDSGKIDLQNK